MDEVRSLVNYYESVLVTLLMKVLSAGCSPFRGVVRLWRLLGRRGGKLPVQSIDLKTMTGFSVSSAVYTERFQFYYQCSLVSVPINMISAVCYDLRKRFSVQIIILLSACISCRWFTNYLYLLAGFVYKMEESKYGARGRRFRVCSNNYGARDPTKCDHLRLRTT